MPHCVPNKPCDVDDCFYCPNEPRRPIGVIMPESKKACKHDKVYANWCYTVSPPIYPWICSKCGEEGQDQVKTKATNNYEMLKRKFKKS